MTQGARGFTLVELMVTIAIAAILAAIAFPSFESTMRSNRVTTSTNGLLAAIAFARSEAIRSTQVTRLCPSSDGASCTGTTDWNTGWLVISGSTPLRYIDANPQVTAALSAGSSPIDFDARGRPRDNAVQRVFTIRPASCSGGQPYVRTLTVTASGLTNVSRGNC